MTPVIKNRQLECEVMTSVCNEATAFPTRNSNSFRNHVPSPHPMTAVLVAGTRPVRQ